LLQSISSLVLGLEQLSQILDQSLVSIDLQENLKAPIFQKLPTRYRQKLYPSKYFKKNQKIYSEAGSKEENPLH